MNWHGAMRELIRTALDATPQPVNTTRARDLNFSGSPPLSQADSNPLPLNLLTLTCHPVPTSHTYSYEHFRCDEPNVNVMQLRNTKKASWKRMLTRLRARG